MTALVVAPEPATRLLVRRAMARAGRAARFLSDSPSAAAIAEAGLLVLGPGAADAAALSAAVVTHGGRVVAIVRAGEAGPAGAHVVLRTPMSIGCFLDAVFSAVSAA